MTESINSQTTIKEEETHGYWWGVYCSNGRLIALAPLKETADDICCQLWAEEWREGVTVQRRSDLDIVLS